MHDRSSYSLHRCARNRASWHDSCSTRSSTNNKSPLGSFAIRSKSLPLSLSRSSLMSLKFPFSFTKNRLACSRSALNKSVLRLPSIETYPISHLFKHFSKSGVSKIFRKLSCAFCGCSEFPYNPDDTIILNGVKHLMESLRTLLFCIRCLKVGRSKVSDLTVLYQVSEIRVES